VVVTVKCDPPNPDVVPGIGGPSNNDNDSIARGIQRDLNALGNWFAEKAQQARAYLDNKFSRAKSTPTPTPAVEKTPEDAKTKEWKELQKWQTNENVRRQHEREHASKTERVTVEGEGGPSVTTTPLPEERGPTITSTPTPKPRSAWHTGNNKAAPVVPNNTAHGDGPPEVESTTTSPSSEPAGPNVAISEGQADGSVKFTRWKPGDAIDKPLPDGTAPAWGTVQSRYWKNRYAASKGTGEFTEVQLREIRKGNAPKDFNPRTQEWESRELHHVKGRQYEGGNNPENLRELTPDWHAEVDPYRQRRGINATRGIR
jgi:hypothetical protein